jgi:hypothetical protein
MAAGPYGACTLPFELWRAIRTPHVLSVKVHAANVWAGRRPGDEPLGDGGVAPQFPGRAVLCPKRRESLTVTGGGKTVRIANAA